MPLDSLVTTLIKASLNALIKNDKDSLRRLARFNGKVIRVHLTDINKQLIFIFGQSIDVVSQFEGNIDCDLGLALTTLPQLQNKANLTQLLKQDKLQLEGDIDLAQQFSVLLHELHPDIAEWLSQYTGDVIAHTVVQGAQRSVEKCKKLSSHNQRYWREVLIEEWRLLPSGLEIAYFADCVDTLAQQTNSLQQRLEQLEAALDKQANT